MKSTVTKFLIHILSMLMPAEDAINAFIHKAASSQMAQDAEAALAAAERRANQVLNAAASQAESLQVAAREEYAARIQQTKALPPVVTPQGAAALVSAAASATTVAPGAVPALSDSMA